MKRRPRAAAATALDGEERAELLAYRSALDVLTDTCHRLGTGDLEARVPRLPGPERLEQVRWAINHLSSTSPTRSSGSRARPCRQPARTGSRGSS